MTSLRSDLAYFIKSSDQPETFVFNVCGAMTKKCNNQTAAACVTDAAKKEVVFGECLLSILLDESLTI